LVSGRDQGDQRGHERGPGPVYKGVPYPEQRVRQPLGGSRIVSLRLPSLRSSIPWYGSRFGERPYSATGLPAPCPYGLGEAVGDALGEGEAVGDAVGEGEAVGDGEAVGSVVSGPLEGAGVVVVGSVRSVVSGGSYGPLSATDSVIATTTRAAVATGVSTTTSGTRTNGRTRPSKTYHINPATTTMTPATSHLGSTL